MPSRSARRRRRRQRIRKPRVPLPRQTGGAHQDRTKRPYRDRKHKKPQEPE